MESGIIRRGADLILWATLQNKITGIGVPSGGGLVVTGSIERDDDMFWDSTSTPSPAFDLGAEPALDALAHDNNGLWFFVLVGGAETSERDYRLHIVVTGNPAVNTNATFGSTINAIPNGTSYEGGKIWIDTVNGNAGTSPFINGMVGNPVNNISDAFDLAADPSVNLDKFNVGPGSSIILLENSDGKIFVGENWTLDLGGESIVGISVNGAFVSGIAAGVGARQNFDNCSMLATTHIKGTHIAKGSMIVGKQTVGEAGTYNVIDCHSGMEASGPGWDYGVGLGDTEVNFHNYNGRIEVENMNETGSDIMHLQGRGELIINVNSVGGIIDYSGNFRLTDNASEAVALNELANISSLQGDDYGALTYDRTAHSNQAIVDKVETNATGIALVLSTGGPGPWTSDAALEVTLKDNAANRIVLDKIWDALRANHVVNASFGEFVLSNVIRWDGSATIDGKSLKLWAEIMLAYTTGRFRTNKPNPGDIEFYKQNSTAVLFTLHIVAGQRTRN